MQRIDRSNFFFFIRECSEKSVLETFIRRDN